MTTITLTRTETDILKAAAANQGRLDLAATIKPASRARLLARFLRVGLIAASETELGEHHLTASGYRAIGLTPPAKRRAVAPGKPAEKAAAATLGAAAADTAAPSKKEQVLTLLKREQGATLAELIAATGWLPHTVRAALSRIRSGGQVLLKSARSDQAVAYRIPAEVPAPRKRRPARTVEASAPPAQAADAPVVAAPAAQ